MDILEEDSGGFSSDGDVGAGAASHVPPLTHLSVDIAAVDPAPKTEAQTAAAGCASSQQPLLVCVCDCRESQGTRKQEAAGRHVASREIWWGTWIVAEREPHS